ncbi:MAG TPA: alpha-2-macroglobulin [Tahibacter sp.]|uniref:alpha-2-macroglobulin n=1 Tax=Tahibacter sp. TaxID=2056211 RepID=UPI002B9195CE|nr:alpha-2-macroglobulin [Tahibacter sp.]HSX59611.1 alpha-2-macroglobulin [Tahibacter sp.]
MDLLRALARLPLLLVAGLWRLVVFVLRMLGLLLGAIVGRVSWQAPGWMLATERAGLAGWGAVRRNPGRVAIVLGTVAVLAGGGWFAYQYEKNRPKPPAPVIAKLTTEAPSLTDYTSEPVTVHALDLNFSQSVAPLALVGKDVTSGITLDPAVAGRWNWVNDRLLRFTPAGDWPVGQAFRGRFDKKVLFAPQANVDADTFEFATAAFAVRLVGAEFYQDPQDALLKKGIVNLGFTHPVDTAEFEKHVELYLLGPKGQKQPQKFVVNYDKLKLNAWVHSAPLAALPKDSTTLEYRIDKGVTAAAGGKASEAAVAANVSVPGMYSLGVSGVEPTLVDNSEFEPEQVLLVNFSHAVGEKQAAGAIKAWLLPVTNPHAPEGQREQVWSWSSGGVDERVLKSAEPLALEPIAAELDYSEQQSFKFRADPGRYLYVRVGKGLDAFGGYQLARNADNVLQVPDYPRILRFMAEGSLLSLSGDKRVAVVSRNVPGMRLEIARVLPDQLQHLVSFNNGTFAQPELGSLSRDKITERFEQKVAFESEDPTKAHYEGVDLSQYLASGRRGVFLLRLSDYDPASEPAPKSETGAANAELSAPEAGSDESYEGEGEYEGGEGDYEGDYVEGGEINDAKFIVVTDLGLIVKRALDGKLDAYVQSIATGAPVDGANIEILGENGQPLLKATSDAAGHAAFDAVDAFTREKTPAMFVVRKGEDLSFLPIGKRDRSLDFSRFDVGGIKNARSAGQLGAYLFSDRGLYRPGDTFHVGMIVRAADWSRDLSGVPLQADILDARGLSVDKRTVRLGEAGFEELSFTTQETSPTGSWTVNLSLIDQYNNPQLIGSTTVQIKEFLPDRMKATAHLSQEVVEGWIKPENLSARVSLQNLFGTPAQDRRVEATLTLSPVLPVFRSWPDHTFHDPQKAKEGYSEPLGEQTTNAEGIAEFPLDLAKYGTASYRLHFLAKGYEAEGGRSVSAETASLVSSLDYLVGVKVVDNLDYVARGAERSVNLIAIDNTAKRVAVDGLKAVLVERRYVSVLTKQDSGAYKYQSRLKEVPVKEEPLKLAAGGVDFRLATDAPGDYALLIRNGRGETLNQVSYSVAGEANVARSLERNAELQLALSKKDYAPGEDVEIAVRAPYTGAGLITIERDKVYAHQWFKATTTASVQKIRVPADFEGNGYINVQYVRDPASAEIFMSPLSYGIAPFSVNRDARRNALDITAPGLIKPGDTLTMKVTSGVRSRIAVFAVDEGILQVARYTLGDPLDHFFQKRMLEVSTSQILDQILPEFARLTGMAAPGGDGDGLLGKHLNPFKKKRKPPVAWWSGIVDIDGSRDFTWTVPDDFNGKLRLMAISVAADRIGRSQDETTVRGDFVLSPNVPAMVAPGDEFDVSVGVANNLTGLNGKEAKIAVKLEPSAQVEAVGAATQELSLAEMREGSAVFRLRAKGEPGAATLKFVATSGDKSAKQSVDMSVRPAVPFRTDVAIGSLNIGDKLVKPLRDMYDAHARREANASYVPLVLARGLSAYLTTFPHRCTEQLLSAAVPALVFDSNPEFGKLLRDPGDTRTTKQAFAELLAVLRSRQNDEGGYGLWTATPESQRYVSVYATQYLLEAKDRGWNVPQDMLDKSNRYLGTLAADESDGSLAGLRERAFAIYLLTRQGNVTTNALASVRQRLQDRHADSWMQDTAAAYLAASLQLMKQEGEALKLIVGPEKVLTRAAIESGWRYERYYDPLVRDGATLYLLAKHFPERAKALPAAGLENVMRPLSRGLFNTLSSATTILALDAYAKQVSALGGDKLRIFELAKDGAAKAISRAEGLVVTANFGAAADGVRVANEADANAWYSVTQAGFDRNPPAKEIKEGLEIVREYTDADGKVIDRVELGQEILVKLKIRSTRSDGVGDTAVVDLLPGGFEVVQEIPAAPAPESDEEGAAEAAAPAWRSTVGLATSTWAPDYADVRDDRVVIYGTAMTSVREFVYRIKATNVGSYVVPPAYAESMYERTVQAQSLGGRITVVKPD